MADEKEQVGQDEIEALLQQARQAGERPAADVSPPAEPPADPPQPKGAEGPHPELPDAAPGVTVSQQEIESLLAKGGRPAAPASGRPAPPAEDRVLGQSEIEQLLAAKGKGSRPSRGRPQASLADAPPEEDLAPEDVELLLRQAEQALASVEAGGAPLPPDVRTYQLQELSGARPTTEAASFELVRDVDLDLRIELGRTHMHLEEVLKLRRGAVVALDKLAGDPVDIYVNGRLIGRGEILVLNDSFCVRVAELITADNAVA